MIRIVIAEKQQMLLGTIGSLLNLEEDMEVVGQVSNRMEVIHLVHQLQPNICILDIDLDGESGLELAEELKELGCKIIVMTTFARNGYDKRALQVGVNGYLLKDSPSEVLACSIRSVMAGKQVYEPELMEKANEDEIVIDEKVHEHNHAIGTVKAYFSTIMDKMKLPTG
ncbi:response regulator [Bacillus sp. CGMCC 1.16607]|uniref:response regulator n=1 Tax=Bacillus sp. CGMCC 1.16607 TaxID=3351842 RepID=UPI003639F242